jgi:serine/threonine protein kinase
LPLSFEGNIGTKRLSTRERGEAEAIARLRSEAELLARLGSTPAAAVTPRLMDRGEDERGPWHRLERVELRTVAEIVEQDGPRDAVWVERAAEAALGALVLLHEAADSKGALGIVHADLSPANLAIDVPPNGAAARAIVLDFDLAWWREGPPRDGAFRGTIGYAAPEVARGERPTPASDLFSLAAVLLFARTGASPRPERRSFAAILADAAETSIVERAESALGGREREPGAGPGHAVILRCLAHDPAERPASARAALW